MGELESVSTRPASLCGMLEDGVQVREAVGIALLSCLSSSAFPIDLVTLVISFELGFALGKKGVLKKKRDGGSGFKAGS